MPLLKNPHWPLIIDLYFFLVGLAAGAFIVAGIAELFGRREDRVVTKVGSYLALLALIPGPILLIIDLGMPNRFLHMLMVSKPYGAQAISQQWAITIGPFHIKPYSPMNLGAWALLGFGLCAFVTSLTLFLEDKGGGNFSGIRKVFGAIGSLFGFFVAAYPGQLLAATARPFWTDARPMGALFLAVGATTGMAAVALVLSLMGPEVGRNLAKVRRAYTIALFIQILALFAVFLAMQGAPAWSRDVFRVMWSGPYAFFFWVGAVILGIVVPLVLEFRDGFLKGYPGRAKGLVAVAAILILLGGFLIKYVIAVAGQAV